MQDAKLASPFRENVLEGTALFFEQKLGLKKNGD